MRFFETDALFGDYSWGHQTPKCDVESEVWEKRVHWFWFCFAAKVEVGPKNVHPFLRNIYILESVNEGKVQRFESELCGFVLQWCLQFGNGVGRSKDVHLSKKPQINW